MKKWKYMIVDFDDRKLRMINGEEVENFVKSEIKYPLFFSSMRDNEYVPAQGTYITVFLKDAGENGWEAVNFTEGSKWTTILFKSEIET